MDSFPTDAWLRAAACVDLRAPEAYAALRPAGAVRLEVDDLLHRPYLLPARSRPLVLIGGRGDDLRVVVEALHAAGHAEVRHLPGETWRRHFPAEAGAPTRMHLWEPSRALVEALEAHALLGEDPGVAPRASATRPLALDLACGSGRNAVYLALHGFDVTAIDILPDALEKTQDLARRSGARLRVLPMDLEFPGALDDLEADLVVVVRYLERPLFGPIARALRPGGLLVYETFTADQAALGHPRNPRFLLQPGELRDAFPALRTLAYQEGFFDGAHLARLVARREKG